MADLKELTPWILGLLSLAVSWLFKSVVEMGKDIVAIQTACKYYFERTGKGAAMVLDSPNPTPDNVRQLLRRYSNGTASAEDVQELKAWLKELIATSDASKVERSAAIDILSSMGAMKILDREKSKASHGH